jgi:hypothetical protein
MMEGKRIPSPDYLSPVEIAANLLEQSKHAISNSRPGDRSAQDRYHAMAVSEIEKVIAFVHYYLLDKQP